MVAYIHRVGMTGRAGETGRAVTLYTYDDAPYLRIVANVISWSGVEVPEWIMKIRGRGRKDRKQLTKKPVRRDKISSQP
jgi:ATP-dependent RNA helicase DDX52/ROK1